MVLELGTSKNLCGAFKVIPEKQIGGVHFRFNRNEQNYFCSVKFGLYKCRNMWYTKIVNTLEGGTL
jgi:hypothetical protein